MNIADRYLRLLGIPGSPAGVEGLRAVVRAHVVRVPFENVSKLLLHGREHAARPITLPEFLDGIEDQDLGGTCYSSNPYLGELLRALGYDVDLLGADMSEPNVHTSLRVRVDGMEFHVDVGYGAPFYEPMRLAGLPHDVPWGRYLFRLTRSARDDGYELSHFEDGQRRHGYVVHPPARPFDFFRPTIVTSYEPSRTFMRCLRIVRFFDDYSVELHNRQLTVSRGAISTDTCLETLADLRHACDHLFRMPRCPIEQAVAVLESITGAPFFGDAPEA